MNNVQGNFINQGRWGWLVLFTSSATLICCALPILLVTLGLGAVSASLFSTLPFLVVLAWHFNYWRRLGLISTEQSLPYRPWIS